MKKAILLFAVVISSIVLTGCTQEDPCGEGTTLVGDTCVLDSQINNPTPGTGTVSCTTEPGLHSVPGGKAYTIASWLNWNIIIGPYVSNYDTLWIQEFGAAMFNVHTTPNEPWEVSYSQSGMFLSEGCEYSFEFTLRTESPNMKPDVIVFGEPTNGGSYFEEVVPLTESSRTFRFTVIPTESEYFSIGVYMGGSTGMVIIEEIQVERYPIGTDTTND